jgi:predicted DNA-binding transcriptional regulator AlpA
MEGDQVARRSNPEGIEMTSDNEKAAPKLRPMLSMKQVLNIVPVSRTTLWRMITDGKFPKSRTLSDGRVAWFEDEIIAWQTALVAA